MTHDYALRLIRSADSLGLVFSALKRVLFCRNIAAFSLLIFEPLAVHTDSLESAQPTMDRLVQRAESAFEVGPNREIVSLVGPNIPTI